MTDVPESDSPPWRRSLEVELRVFLSVSDSAIRATFLTFQRANAIASEPCGRCHIVYPVTRLVRLVCGHQRCDGCLRGAITDFVLPKYVPGTNTNALADREVKRVRRHFFLCDGCFNVSIISTAKISFDPTICSFPPIRGPPSGAVPDIVVMRSLTEEFSECIRRAVYFANERYNIFGMRFSPEYIMPLDYRGQYSDDNHNAVDPESDFQLPNSAWRWATEWMVDTSMGDAEGWQYAVNWPDTGIIPGQSWHNTLQFTDFVRRRRMIRLMICFNTTLAERLLDEVAPV